MALGPVELLVVTFPGNTFKGEIAPTLEELGERGTIRDAVLNATSWPNSSSWGSARSREC